MENTETADEKYIRMTETPVKKLICTLAIPTIISMLITAVYNMADTFFVGNIGTSATGAIGISFSLMAIIQAVGFICGMGSGNYISRLLGNKERKRAADVAATGFFTSIFIGIIISVVGWIFIDKLVYFLGATDTIHPYAKRYIGVILIGAPYMIACFVMNNILRFQGSAFYSMIGIASGGILNIILDPLFIFIFNMGVAGAALATIISQFVSFCILFCNCSIGGNIKIKFENFTPELDIYKEILKGGLPSFYRQGLASLATIFLNLAAGPYGDAAIAAMSIVTRVFQFALSALIGFGQGFQPVCGFNFGAQKYKRVLDAFWFCVRVAVVVLIIIGIIGFIIAPELVKIFRKDDLEVVAIGTRALRFQCVTFPLASWIILNNMLLQTIGKSKEASILSLSRQGLFFIPLIIILPNIIGLLGVQLTQSVSDIFTFILSVPMGLKVIKELNESYRNSLSK